MKKNKRNLPRYLGLMLLLFSVSLASFAQQNIRGKVFDPDGAPLLGATVVVNGTSSGTITDVNGNYTLNAPAGAELKFSYVGMVNLIEKINGRTTINVTLQSDAIGLNEIIAVGYGTMKKTDITGAVGSVKGDKLTSMGSFSAAQALQGKISGVTVISNGDAGSDSKIRIRGVNTIGNNDPLIVVDGVTIGGSIRDIHPSDIESIDVLKDASALAIYGSRASSGVIQITTKKGSYGEQKLQLGFNASYGVANFTKRLDLLTSAEIVAKIDEARTNENKMLGNTAQKLYAELFADATKYPDPNWGTKDITDWQDELFSPGAIQDYSLTAQGGSKNSNYAFSASYRTDEGIMPGNFSKRLTLRGSMEGKVLNDKLKIGTIFSFTSRESRSSSQGDIWASDINACLFTPGNIPAKKANGVGYQETDAVKINYFTPGSLYQNNAAIFNDFSNPNNNFVNQIYADLQIIKGLNFKTSFGQSYGNNFSRNYKIASENPEGGGLSELNVNSNYSKSISWDNTLTFDKRFGDLNVLALAGTNIVDTENNGLSGGRSTFPDGDNIALRYLGFGSAAIVNGETAGDSRLASYFGRLNLNYKDKYLFTATVRQDGSSRFHESGRWGTFPSASLGWRISEEDFMKSIGFFDLLKIRGSWGQVGNQNVGTNYAYLSTVRTNFSTSVATGGSTDYSLGVNEDRNIGKVLYDRGNNDVTWETSTMSNLGLDYAFGSFDGSLEFFNTNTTDVLLPSQVPDFAGYYPGRTPKVNAGEINNKGIDFNINYSKSINKLNFSVGASFTYAENKIISLSKNEFVESNVGLTYKGITGNISRSYVGDPIGSFYGYNVLGIFNKQEEVDAANQKARDYAAQVAIAAGKPLTATQLAGIYYNAARTSPGDVIFEDVNGDGRITDLDKKNLGSGNPKFQFGLNLSADYMGFDLTANFSGTAGVQIYTLYEPVLSIPSRFNSLASIKDHWTPENPTSTNPRYTFSDPNGNVSKSTSKYIHDGSYLRLQNLNFGYTLPNKLVSNIGLSSLRLYLSAQNVFTITKYPFYDPEVISNDAYMGGGNVDLSAGVDAGSAPMPTTIIFGLNVKF